LIGRAAPALEQLARGSIRAKMGGEAG